MPSTPQSLVLGFAAGLSADHFEPFIASLRQSGYRGRFGLITARCTPEQRTQLARLADVHWDVDDQFDMPTVPCAVVEALRWMRRTRGVRRFYPAAFQAVSRTGSERNSQRRWESLEFQLEGLQALRYRLYYQFIEERVPDADVILVSDLRDVLFQGDPFEQEVEGLELFFEDDKSRLGSDPFNSRWIRDLYGPSQLREWAQCSTSCSGTTVGTKDALLDYLAKMSAAVQWRRIPLGSHDQGIHNGLLRSGAFPGATLRQNGRGRVLTMGLMSITSTDPDASARNEDGTRPPVLHQYDRHQELAAQLLTRFAGSPPSV